MSCYTLFRAHSLQNSSHVLERTKEKWQKSHWKGWMVEGFHGRTNINHQMWFFPRDGKADVFSWTKDIAKCARNVMWQMSSTWSYQMSFSTTKEFLKSWGAYGTFILLEIELLGWWLRIHFSSFLYSLKLKRRSYDGCFRIFFLNLNF